MVVCASLVLVTGVVCCEYSGVLRGVALVLVLFVVVVEVGVVLVLGVFVFGATFGVVGTFGLEVVLPKMLVNPAKTFFSLDFSLGLRELFMRSNLFITFTRVVLMAINLFLEFCNFWRCGERGRIPVRLTKESSSKKERDKKNK